MQTEKLIKQRNAENYSVKSISRCMQGLSPPQLFWFYCEVMLVTKAVGEKQAV